MRYFYLVVDGFGPVACHMEEVAKGLLCDYIYDRGYEVSDCFVAFEAGINETAAKIYLEAFRHMRTCLYGEFQDSEYFDVGFVDVTDELDTYQNEMHELIVVSDEDKLSVQVLMTACL